MFGLISSGGKLLLGSIKVTMGRDSIFHKGYFFLHTNVDISN